MVNIPLDQEIYVVLLLANLYYFLGLNTMMQFSHLMFRCYLESCMILDLFLRVNKSVIPYLYNKSCHIYHNYSKIHTTEMDFSWLNQSWIQLNFYYVHRIDLGLGLHGHVSVSYSLIFPHSRYPLYLLYNSTPVLIPNTIQEPIFKH